MSWNASPDGDVAGYEIVWRDSTAALWTDSRKVGNVTTATIENLNKDNVQVGVRAIDHDGNRSPVATRDARAFRALPRAVSHKPIARPP